MNNRRFVLVDESVVNPLIFYGTGIGEIYTISDAEKGIASFRLNKGDAAILVGSKAFEFLRNFHHFGIRNENYYDCSNLRRLSVSGGGFVKVVHESKIPSHQEIKDFLSPEFTIERDTTNYSQKIVKTASIALNFLKYFTEIPLGYQFGFDYEASGMATDEEYYVAGFAIATENLDSAYISLTDIRRNNTKEEYQEVLNYLRLFLDKHQRNIWTYNMQYEQQATWRLVGLDAEFCDASVYNVLDGLHSKKYSLKWTAQRLLEATVWDTDFDILSDLMDKMYFTTRQIPGTTGKKNMEKVLKVTKNDFQSSAEWLEIIKNYPSQEVEFKNLIFEYFGMPFMNIPADILGYYCNLDSLNTLSIHLNHQSRFTEDCRETYLDNIRLGAKLHTCGMYKDEEFRKYYDTESSRLISYSLTYSSTVRCFLKMGKHKAKAKPLSSYPKYSQILLQKGEFFSGSSIDITKELLAKNLNDCYDHGVDEGKLAIKYGQDFAAEFITLVKNAIVSTKYKGKIDETIVRKKKILGEISENLIPLLGLQSGISDRDLELEKFLWYQKAYKEFSKVWSQMGDINHIPNNIKFLGKTYTLDEYSEMLINEYFKCSSPIDSAEITSEFTELFKLETVFLTSLYSNINNLPDGKDFYRKKGINSPSLAFEHWKKEYEIYCKGLNKRGICFWPDGYIPEYPVEVFVSSNSFWRDPASDDMTTTWDNFDGYTKQSTFFDLSNDWVEMSKEYDFNNPDSETMERFSFMRKMVLHIMMAKKYMKVKSTYMNGLFLNNDHLEIDTPNFIPISHVSPGTPGSVVKMHPRYQVLEKETKRWSSPYHTIISHSDIKSVINTPPGYLLSYFDISSAEVRTVAYISKDPVMIHLFETRQDLYIHVAKIYFGEDRWKQEDSSFKKLWRGRFKTILLGVMYGMGVKKLSVSLGVSVVQAQELIDTLFGQFKVLHKYIEDNMAFPENHDGYINTLLGDKLRSGEWRFVRNPDGTINRFSLAKVQRHGINYQIQSASAVALARGFWNNIRQAKKEGFILSPIIVVHDSNTNYFPIEKLFEMRSFYEKNFTEFCEKQMHIPFLFDLLIGSTYNDAVELKQTSPDKMIITGNAHSILKILWKIDNESSLKYTMNIEKDKIIPNYITNPMQRFIIEKGTSILMDHSEYSVELTKVL